MAQDTAADTLRLERFAAGLEEAAATPGAGTPEAPASVEARDGSRPARADSRTTGWFGGVEHGFYGKALDAAGVARIVPAYAEDARVLTGVYDDGAPAFSLAGDVPVATFATFRKPLNVGGGRELPCHLVTAVTVRASHRRRGLLRRMMAEDLALAKANGLAMAALTASEATIYGRFGFGIATHQRAIRLDVRGGLAMHAPRTGTVVSVPPSSLETLHEQIHALFHRRSRGSLGRQAGYRYRATGRWSGQETIPNPSLRAAVHLGADGVPRGFATFEFAGWDHEPHTMRIQDLVAADAEAQRELFRFLGEHDLVERLEFGGAPVDDPLQYALLDPRRYAVTGIEDHLWLRVLDVPAALGARGYDGGGRVVLRVRDPLGFAAGVFEVAAAGGTADVRKLPEDQAGPVDAELDVAELSSLYLGGVAARTLVDAGRIEARDAAAAARFAAVFDVFEPPQCSTSF